jgi:hypothetical protein
VVVDVAVVGLVTELSVVVAVVAEVCVDVGVTEHCPQRTGHCTIKSAPIIGSLQSSALMKHPCGSTALLQAVAVVVVNVEVRVAVVAVIMVCVRVAETIVAVDAVSVADVLVIGVQVSHSTAHCN